jgi:hypothetical protein
MPMIEYVLATIFTLQSGAYRFQSETVTHENMAKGSIVV